MTTGGEPENDSRIQNEEHDHTATAKRTVLVDSQGNFATIHVDLDIGTSVAVGTTLTVNSTATLVGSDTDRLGTFVQNLSSTHFVWIGKDATVNTTTSFFARLGPGETFSSFLKSTVYAISTTSTTVSYILG